MSTCFSVSWVAQRWIKLGTSGAQDLKWVVLPSFLLLWQGGSFAHVSCSSLGITKSFSLLILSRPFTRNLSGHTDNLYHQPFVLRGKQSLAVIFFAPLCEVYSLYHALRQWSLNSWAKWVRYIFTSCLRKGSCRDSYSPKGALHGATDPRTRVSQQSSLLQ